MQLLGDLNTVVVALNTVGGQNNVRRDALLVVIASFVLPTVSMHTSKSNLSLQQYCLCYADSVGIIIPMSSTTGLVTTLMSLRDRTLLFGLLTSSGKNHEYPSTILM